MTERHYPKVRPPVYDATRWVMRALFRLLTRVRVESLDSCPDRGPAIVVVNHLSYFDGPLVFAMLPIRVRPLVADRFQRHPFGLLLALTGAIFVHRGQPDRAAMRAILEVLEDGGCVAVAIEGARSPDGRLQQGKNGVAYVAAKSGAPLVPAAVWGTERIGACLRRLRRPEVHLRLGSPLALGPGPMDTCTLDEATRGIMERIAAMLPPAYLQEP